MRSHHSLKPTFYFEYFCVQVGIAIRTVPVKISEVLFQVCFTFSDKLLSIHTTSDVTQFSHIKHSFILENPEVRKQWMLCFLSSFNEEPLTVLRCSSILATWTWFYHMTIQYK